MNPRRPTGSVALIAGLLLMLTIALVSTAAYATKPENRHDCGGPLQRACCLHEAFPSCDPGLVEIAGCHDPDLCGGCSSGYCNYFAPTADDFDHCGGPGQRACCGNEVGPLTRKCDKADQVEKYATEVMFCEFADCSCGPGGDVARSTCIATTPCGGLGQRACCSGELIADRSCKPGYVEIAGCTGDCLCGGGEGGLNLFQFSSNGTCIPEAGTAPALPVASEPTTNWTPSPTPPRCAVSGYADLHAHMFAHLGSGGAVFAGKPYDPDGDVNTALAADFGTDLDIIHPGGGPMPAPACPFYLPSCGTKHFHGNHIVLPLFDIGTDDPTGAGTGDTPKSPLGVPIFNGWPTWTTTTHQQMYYTWLERAYRGGLRLMVQMAVTNEALCKSNKRVDGTKCNESMLPPSRLADLDRFNDRFEPLDADPPALPPIETQLQAAYAFEKWLDDRSGGDGQGWFRIVRTPAEARQVIADGKLAVVLGIEVDHPFGCGLGANDLEADDPVCTAGDVRAAVDKYYDKGVRHIFPIHNFDNQFGAPAAWQDAINVGNRVAAEFWTAVEDCEVEGYGFWFDGFTQLLIATIGFGILEAPVYVAGQSVCNANGLSNLGVVLLDKLMDKGMIIDIDHMGKKTLDATLLRAESRSPSPYPLVASHAIFFDLHQKEFGDNAGRHERMRTRAQLDRIKALGGMVAAMLKDDVQDTGKRGVKVTVSYGDKIADDCIHSTKTWGQAYQYAVETMGGPVAVGSDFNGVAGHVGPRFGTDGCGGDAGLLTPDSKKKSHLKQLGTELKYPFTLQGFGTFEKQKTGEKEFDFNGIGLAHVGLLPDMIADLRQIGLSNADLDPLFKSAEKYIQVWEKARGETSPVTPGLPSGACLDGPTGNPSLALGDAMLWIGLANSDAQGLRLDLQADVSLNGTLLRSGELLDVPAGSSGFNNAKLRAIALGTDAIEVPGGGELAVTVKVRRTCSTTKGHRSGWVRLWHNGQPVDAGTARERDAGSRVAVTVNGETRELFLRTWPTLSETAGSARTFGDLAVNSEEACPDRPYAEIGTWRGPVPSN